MFYLVTMPGCPACEKRLAELREAGTKFTEVNGETLCVLETGERLSHDHQWTVSTELAWHNMEVPLLVEVD